MIVQQERAAVGLHKTSVRDRASLHLVLTTRQIEQDYSTCHPNPTMYPLKSVIVLTVLAIAKAAPVPSCPRCPIINLSVLSPSHSLCKHSLQSSIETPLSSATRTSTAKSSKTTDTSTPQPAKAASRGGPPGSGSALFPSTAALAGEFFSLLNARNKTLQLHSACGLCSSIPVSSILKSVLHGP